MRINKFLSRQGMCSRREADRLINEKRVTINGVTALLGDDVDETFDIRIDGKQIDVENPETSQRVILAYNKPAGLICSNSDKDGKTVFDSIDYPKRLFYVGRLDKFSRGLLLLTNDGDFANSLMKGKYKHEREYEVVCDTKVSDDQIAIMRRGVYLKDLDIKTRKCYIKRIDDKSFTIVLTQGLNRQIRRMCEAVGLHVRDLCRVRIENISLGRLHEGTLRKLTVEEKESLLALVERNKKNQETV